MGHSWAVAVAIAAIAAWNNHAHQHEFVSLLLLLLLFFGRSFVCFQASIASVIHRVALFFTWYTKCSFSPIFWHLFIGVHLFLTFNTQFNSIQLNTVYHVAKYNVFLPPLQQFPSCAFFSFSNPIRSDPQKNVQDFQIEICFMSYTYHDLTPPAKSRQFFSRMSFLQKTTTTITNS